MKTVLFHRNYKEFQGGHLKVRHYFDHVLSTQDHEAFIYFTPDSNWDEMNPWNDIKERVLPDWQIDNADLLLFDGIDWYALNETQRTQPPAPIINLIQHVRHGDPNDRCYPFLKYKAIRICVSEDVANSIRATGQVNGPIFVIPVGFEKTLFDQSFIPFDQRDIDITIVGIKHPKIARLLSLYLHVRFPQIILQKKIEVITKKIPRSQFLSKLSRTKITIVLPNVTEGMYMVPAEGMANGSIVICPAGLGRNYCVDGLNCFLPEYTFQGIGSALKSAMRLSEEEINLLQSDAKKSITQFTLEAERKSFLEILRNVDQIW